MPIGNIGNIGPGFPGPNIPPNPQDISDTVEGVVGAAGGDTGAFRAEGLTSHITDNMCEFLANPNNHMYPDSRGGLIIQNNNGQVVFSIPVEQMGLAGLTDAEKEAQLDAIQQQLGGLGIDGVWGLDENGNIYADMGGGGAAGPPPSGVTQHGSSVAADSGGAGNRGTTNAGTANDGTSGSSGIGNQGGGFPTPPSIIPPGGVPPLGEGGAGDEGITVGNITDPGRRGTPGSGFFEPQGGAPGLNSLFDFLPPNFNELGPEERMSALIGAVTRRQEQGLENQVNRFDASQRERLERGAGVRALEDKILGDTDVFSERDIQRIAGRQTERGNQAANVLATALGERRAAAGSARSGSAQTERSAILTEAANRAAQGEADIRAQARQANFGSRLQALGGVGASQRADVRQGFDINRAAAGAIEAGQVFGDAFLTQNLLNRQSSAHAQAPALYRDFLGVRERVN
jgi:hypothetical protein